MVDVYTMSFVFLFEISTESVAASVLCDDQLSYDMISITECAFIVAINKACCVLCEMLSLWGPGRMTVRLAHP